MDYIFREIHEGICGSHLAGIVVALKALRLGYYWPRMKKEALELIKSCDKCQRFAKVQRQPATEQTSITSPWLFDQWDINLLRPFPTTIDQLKFVVVTIDYFTEWAKAEPLTSITTTNVQKFIWRAIIYR